MSSPSTTKQRLIGAGVLVAIVALSLPFILGKESVPESLTVDIPEQPVRSGLNLPEQPIELAEIPQQLQDDSTLNTAPNVDPDRAASDQQIVLLAEDKVADTVVISSNSAAANTQPKAVEPKPVAKPAPVEKKPAAPKVAESKPVAPKVEPKPKPAPKPPVAKPAPVKPAAPAKPVVTAAPKPAANPGLNNNNLPASWSVQLAKLSKRDGADALRDTFRAKQYNAYVRAEGGFYFVRIGPLVKQADAQALCKRLKQREQQDCFVVSFKP